jgi:acetylornithine deacetylase/succinyl-diaminopimelate desuccinylase-like protein
MQLQLETTLAKLVSIPSVSNNAVACHVALDYVRSEIEQLGLFVQSDMTIANPWLLATTKETKTPDILLAAHLDVVPGPAELFKLRKEGGKLYGRGVYDMKFAAACYIELLKAHANELSDLNIGVLFTTDEETGGDCMPDILEAGLRPDVVFLPDGGMKWRLEARAKGLWGMELTARGRAAHGSRPWKGNNAIHRLMDALQVLRESFPSQDPAGSTLSINELHGGKVINQVADHALAKLDFRSFSVEDLAAFRAHIDQLCATYNLELSVTHHGQPVILNKEAPSVQKFIQAFQAFSGHNVQYHDSYGGSDARHFALYGIPCLIIEARGGHSHEPSEWHSADDLLTYYQLIEHWIFPETASAKTHARETFASIAS